MKIKKHLGFKSLRELLSSTFNKIKDGRQSHKIEHSVHDSLMSGFACMFFQEPSLLQFQIRLEKKLHKNNLKELFDVQSIPESTQLRTIIDKVESSQLGSFFKECFYRLQRGKHLEQFELFKNLYLCPLDGTQFFSSGSISCPGCLTTKHKKKKGSNLGLESSEIYENEESSSEEEDDNVTLNYSHKVLQAAIMHPNMKQVIPLMPEEIRNEDGTMKQDCEVNAAKRLIPQIRKEHPQLGLIIGGDDLFSRQPIIELVKEQRMHYIFSAKPTSHTYLMEWLKAYLELNKLEVEDKKNGRHVYEWMNQVPLHGGKDAPEVNYFTYTMFKTDKKGIEKIAFKSSWVTDLEITKKNVETLVAGGRCRWKIENECFNTLKNQGYCLEHNYGHGAKNLCFNFYLLTLMAFTFHQIFELTDKGYQLARKSLGSKRHLWENLRSFIKIMVYNSWEHLLEFTIDPEKFMPKEPSG